MNFLVNVTPETIAMNFLVNVTPELLQNTAKHLASQCVNMKCFKEYLQQM